MRRLNRARIERAPCLALSVALVSAAAAPALAQSINYGNWLPGATVPVLAVHAALMPPKDAASPATVLMFGGSQYEPTLQVGTPLNPGLLEPISKNGWAQMNTQTGVMSRLNLNSTWNGTTDDMFCGAQAHDADGNLVIAGGTEYYATALDTPALGDIPSNLPPLAPCLGLVVARAPSLLLQNINRQKCALRFAGNKALWRYDTKTGTLVAGPRMARGRWYPTLVRGDNAAFPSLVAMAGWPEATDTSAEMNNNDVETIAASGAPTNWVRSPNLLATTDLYPRAFLTPYLGGSIVVASPRATSNKSSVLLPNTSGGFLSIDFAAATVPAGYEHYHSSGVLLPFRPDVLGQYGNGKILLTNQAQPQLLDLNQLTPVWTPTSARKMTTMRMDAVATILATGDILVSGGMDPTGSPDLFFENQNDGYDGAPNMSVPRAEIYREDTGTWDLAASASIVRHYHQVALLLPDGSVLAAGGNKHGKFSRTLQPSVPAEGRVLQSEVFVPWYAQQSMSRPSIADTTPDAPRSGDWTIKLASGTTGASITRVALIAPGSVTHAFDVDQRYVELRVVARTADSVTVSVPANRYVLPGGAYMLFVSRSSNGNPAGAHVPSVAKWRRVPSQ